MNFSRDQLQNIRGKLEVIKHREDFKRLPQVFKRNARVGSYTIDEEYDHLYKNLSTLECHLRIVVKYSGVFTEEIKKQLKVSKTIGEAAQALYDPYNNLSSSVKDQFKTLGASEVGEEYFKSDTEKDTFIQDYRSWSLAKEYMERIEYAKEIIGDPSLTASSIKAKCEECLQIIETIKTKSRKRNNLLDDYDAICNTLDGLFIKEQKNELSAKEAQTQFHLERKGHYIHLQYEVINNLFKKELPYFLSLATTFTQPLLLLLFFIQLLVSYQMSQSLLTFQEFLGFEVNNCANEELMAAVEQLYLGAQTDIEKMYIVKFRDHYYQQLTESQKEENDIKTHVDSLKSSTGQLYRALYDFKALVEGDLDIQTGDIIELIEANGDWMCGRIGERTGVFPGNYVERIN